MRPRKRSTPESVAARRAERAQLTESGPVMEAAAAFLAVRPRSVAEVTRRMRHLGYPDALVEDVVTRLVEMGYLDDETFARTWVESRDRARPRGEIALRRELALKGIARDTVDQLMTERAACSDGRDTDVDAALRLLERKRASIERQSDPRKRRQRAYALLARNGFDSDTCSAAAAAFVSAPSD